MKKKMLFLASGLLLLATASLSSCGTKDPAKPYEKETVTETEAIDTDENTLDYEECANVEYFALAINAGYTGTYKDFLESIKATKIEMKKEDNFLYWRYKGSDWTPLYNLANSLGDPGLSAYQIYQKYHQDYTGTEDDFYTDLVAGNLVTTSSSNKNETKELSYKLDITGTYYIVTGIGNDIEAAEITIPSTYKNLPVKAIDEYAFYYRNDIKKITIADSVTEIGAQAFMGCSQLESITFKSNKIGIDAFYGCSHLSEVLYNNTLDKWLDINFSNEYSNPMKFAGSCKMRNLLGDYFNYNTAIVLDIPSTVTEIKPYTLINFTNLLNIVIPNSVTSIAKGSLSGCSGLYSITVPFVGDGSNETETGIFGYIFGDESYNLSYKSTASFNSDGDNVSYYIPSKLETIVVSNQTAELGYGALQGLNVKKFMLDVKGIGDHVFDNSTFNGITISESIKSIGEEAFMNNTGIKSIDLSNVESIGKNAFKGCKNLEHVKTSDKLTTIGEGAFEGCESLSDFYFSKNLESIAENTFKGCKELKEIKIQSAKTIGKNAFYECTNTTILELPDNVEIIEDNAFNHLANVKEVVIPGTCKIVGKNALSNMYKLESLTIPTLGVAATLDDAKKYGYTANDMHPGAVLSAPGYGFAVTVGSLTHYIPKTLTNLTINTIRDTDLVMDSEYTKGLLIENISITDDSSYKSSTGTNIPFYLSSSTDKKRNIDFGSLETIPETTSFKNLYAASIDLGHIAVNSTQITELFQNCTKINMGSGLTKMGQIPNNSIVNFLDLGSISEIDSNSYTYFAKKSTNLISITGNNLTTVPNYAFSECTNLKYATFKNATTVENSAFYKCSKLQNTNFEQLTTIGNNGFNSCISLETLKSSKLTTIGESAFNNCEKLKTVDISNVTDISIFAFYKCTNLENVDTSKATTIGKFAFYQCSSLGNIDTSNVTSVGTNAFDGCTNITELNLDKCDSVYSYAFANSGLLELYLPNVITVKSDIIANSACKKAVFGDKVDSAEENILRNANKIESLETGGIRSLFLAHVMNVEHLVVGEKMKNLVIDKSFGDISQITNLVTDEYGNSYIPSKNNDYYALAVINKKETANINSNTKLIAGYLQGNGVDKVKYINIPESLISISDNAFANINTILSFDFTNIKYIGEYAFYDTDITTINAPNCESIDNYAFKDCSNLTSATIGLNRKSGVEFNSGTFSGCTSLKTASLNASICGALMFNGCTSLETFTNSQTKMIVKDQAFSGCSKLTGIDTEITSLGTKSFYNCKLLASVTLTGVTSIPDYCFYDTKISEIVDNKITSIGDYAFYSCNELKQVSGDVTKVGKYAFFDCDNLTSIATSKITTLGIHSFDGVGLTTVDLSSATAIPESAFNQCENLVSVTLNTAGNTIDQYAFYDCEKLTTCNLRYTTSIGKYAFSYTALTKIELNKTSVTIDNYAFTIIKTLQVFDIGALECPTFSITAYNFSCTNITTIILNSSVTSISSNVYSSCTNLKCYQTSTSSPYYYLEAYDLSTTSRTLDRSYALVKVKNCSLTSLSILYSTVIAEQAIDSNSFTHSNAVTISIGSNVEYINSRAFRNIQNSYSIKMTLGTRKIFSTYWISMKEPTSITFTDTLTSSSKLKIYTSLSATSHDEVAVTQANLIDNTDKYIVWGNK